MKTDAATASNKQYSETVPSSEELLLLYKRNKVNQPNFVVSVEEMIALFGGLDIVLEVMLSTPHLNMESEDRKKMHRLLTKFPSETNTEKLEEIPSRWTLDRNHNFIFDLSPFIAKYLYSRRALIPLALMLILPEIFMIVMTNSTSTGWRIVQHIQVIMYWLYPIPWIVAALLSVNKMMIPKIMTTAETWIITATGFIWIIWYGLYSYVRDHSTSNLILTILSTLSGAVLVILFFIWICAIDGIGGWHRNSRVFLLTVFALSFLFFSMYWEYSMEEQTIVIPILGDEGRISLTAKIANSFWVLFLFMAKMAVNAWRKGENQCIAVKEFPSIEWTERTQRDDKPKGIPSVQIVNTGDVKVNRDGDSIVVVTSES